MPAGGAQTARCCCADGVSRLPCRALCNRSRCSADPALPAGGHQIGRSGHLLAFNSSASLAFASPCCTRLSRGCGSGGRRPGMHVLHAESEKHTVVCDIEEMGHSQGKYGLSAAAARARRYARHTGWLQALAGTAARPGSSRQSEVALAGEELVPQVPLSGTASTCHDKCDICTTRTC